jgi:hypothetical protein
LPLPAGPRRQQGLLQHIQLSLGGGQQLRCPHGDERRQLSQHGPGRLQVGVGLGVGGAAALVVDPGQVIAQGVLEDLVGPERQVGGVARDVG